MGCLTYKSATWEGIAMPEYLLELRKEADKLFRLWDAQKDIKNALNEGNEEKAIECLQEALQVEGFTVSYREVLPAINSRLQKYVEFALPHILDLDNTVYVSYALKALDSTMAINFIKSGAKINSHSLGLALKNNDVDVVNLLYEKYPMLFDQPDKGGNSIAHLAISFSKEYNEGVYGIILDNVHSRNSIGDTPLHFAVCVEYKLFSERFSRFVGSNNLNEYMFESKQIENDIWYNLDRLRPDGSLSQRESFSVPIAHLSRLGKIMDLLNLGADPDAENAYGLTPTDITAMHCPYFSEFYNKLVADFHASSHAEL